MRSLKRKIFEYIKSYWMNHVLQVLYLGFLIYKKSYSGVFVVLLVYIILSIISHKFFKHRKFIECFKLFKEEKIILKTL